MSETLLGGRLKERARFALKLTAQRRVILLTDQDGPVSITNDAENVVSILVHAGFNPDLYRIVYRDSTGRWDGIATARGRFAGFILLGAYDEQAAITKALARQPWQP